MALELRPVCEHCGKSLPPQARDAMICTFECTFCADCVREVLKGVCPNCGGNLEPRPIRPQAMLARHPATTKVTRKPVDRLEHSKLVAQVKGSGGEAGS